MAKTTRMSAADAKMMKRHQDEQRQYEINDAVRTLQRAEQIKNDKGLMAGVQKAAIELSKIAGKPSSGPKNKK